MSELSINIIGYSRLGPVDPNGEPAGANRSAEFDVRPLLRDRKAIKFMAKQDQMAVYTAVHAVEQAGLDEDELAEQTGLYFTVGSIPFDAQPLDILYEKSVDNDQFSMQRFSAEASVSLNPLLTFKCLPNMPMFHVSYNLQVRGPYFITYPGAGQWFQSLQQAVIDLQSGRIKHALVGAVADQINPLVMHHLQRNDPTAADRAIDAACVLVLSTQHHDKALARLEDLAIDYQPQDILNHTPDWSQVKRRLSVEAGPVDPSLDMTLRLQNGLQSDAAIDIISMDGISARLRMCAP